MLTILRNALASLALVIVPLTMVAGCETFGAIASPSKIGCTAAEANNCRVIVAASIVKTAQAATSEQLARGVISPAEARRISNTTAAALDLLTQARAALVVADGTVDEQLAALDVLLAQLLREQVMQTVVR